MDLSSARMKLLHSVQTDVDNAIAFDYPVTRKELNTSTMATNVSSQRFCLRWNNHQANLLSVFDQLLQDESFVDVTLAVEGQFLRAHKMVLSACSPYFQALFIGHPDKHPIVILKDVPYKDMKCLLDFMYRGEVSVDQDRLTAFLKVADSLRIKGLTEVNEERCDLPKLTNNLLNNQHLQVPPPQLHRIQQQQPTKRQYPVLNSAPLLGSALTAPKRKRGRPRKLSGSSDFGPGSPNSDTDTSDVRASEGLLPELLEVKMEYGERDRTRESSSERNSNGDDKRDDAPGTSQTGRGNGVDLDAYSIEQLLQPKLERRSSEDSNNSNLVIDLNNKPYLKREISPYSSGTNTSGGTLNTSSEAPFGSFNLSGSLTSSPAAAPPRRPIQTRRVRRRANSSSQDPAEQLTEMSVRGLNLFRYAAMEEGLYKCTECEKSDVIKTFKNKYSFQRHAFLYHEGHQRKVFPCPVCQKEFSRPDKMKNHMKTVHDCFMPKDVVYPPTPVTSTPGYFMSPPQQILSPQQHLTTVQQQHQQQQQTVLPQLLTPPQQP